MDRSTRRGPADQDDRLPIAKPFERDLGAVAGTYLVRAIPPCGRSITRADQIGPPPDLIAPAGGSPDSGLPGPEKPEPALGRWVDFCSAPVAQGTEQRFPKPRVGGSSPSGGTTLASPTEHFRNPSGPCGPCRQSRQPQPFWCRVRSGSTASHRRVAAATLLRLGLSLAKCSFGRAHPLDS